MNKKKILFLLTFITITLTLISTVSAEDIENINQTSTDTTIHTVDGSSVNQMSDDTIQQAINKAQAGDTILITGTNYVHCHIIVNKPLKIISNVGTTMSPCPSQKTGSGSLGVFYLTPEATNTIIEGFTINNDLEDDEYTVPPYGIYNNGANDVTIINCNINSKYGDAILIKDTINTKIINSTAKNSINGINIINTNNAVIENNNISYNSLSGIKIGENVNNTIIITNAINRNIYGINASSSENLEILNNKITNNRNTEDQSRATIGAGVYTNCNVTNTTIRGNFIYQNGMYGVFNDYRVRNLVNEYIQIVDQNYFGFHKQRGIFTGIYVEDNGGGYDYDEENDLYYDVEIGTGHYSTGTGMIFIWSNIFYSELFCGGTSYAPGVLRSANPYKDVVVGNITEITPGVYTFSFNYQPGYNNGSIATGMNAIDMTFFLNKNNTNTGIVDGDVYRQVTIVNGTATADFRNETYLDSENNVIIVGPGSGSFTGGNRPYAFLKVSNIPTDETDPTTTLTQKDLIKTYNSNEKLKGILTDSNNNPIAGRYVNIKLTRTSSGQSKTYRTTTDYNGEYILPITLGVGTYTAETTFEADDNYNESSVKSNIIITEANQNVTILTANPLEKEYGDDDNFTGILTDSNGNVLAGQHISVTLTRLSNNLSKTYNVVSDYRGIYSLVINLGSGNYRADCSYSGVDIYSSASASADITVTDTKKKLS